MLRLCFSDFDANGITGMYRMFLLPESGWRRLLGDGSGGRLLDVGAGSGDVSVTLAPLFDAVETTELSRAMARRLRQRGFVCHERDVAESPPEGPFDAVALLNVLDRAAKPRRLLTEASGLLAPGGRLIVALALPYRPFYFDGPTTPEPLERLDCEARTWEAGVCRLLERELLPLGLTLERLARVPYLSAGDTQRALYELDDVVAVLRRPAAK